MIVRVVIVGILLLLMPSLGMTDERTSDTIVAAIPTDFPPSYYRDPATRKAAGFAVDMLDEIAHRAGLKVTYVFGKPWEELHQMLLDGRADVIPNLTLSESRKKRFIFTDNVERMAVNFITRSGKNAPRKLMPGMKVGAISGSVARDYLAKHPEFIFVEYRDMQPLLFDLLSERIDFVLTATNNIQKLAIDVGVDDKITIVQPPIVETDRAIALRPSDTALRLRLNQAIASFIRSPAYQVLYAKWWGKPKSFWTVQRVVTIMSILLLAVMVALIYWRFYSIVSLNRQLVTTADELHRLKDHLQDEVTLKTKELLVAQEKLVRTERLAAMGELGASMAHEFRNQLGVIRNIGYYLKLKLKNIADETLQKNLSLLDGQVVQTERIIENILLFAQTKTPKRAVVNIRGLLANVVANIRMGLINPVTITITVADTVPETVMLDDVYMTQVFSNIIGNAVDAIKSTADGAVMITATCMGRELVVEVGDNGVGMAPDILAKIFVPLFTTKARGTGLGMPTAKLLVEAHGGTITATSEPGKGTCVTVRLPL